MKKVIGFCVLSAMMMNFVAAGTARAGSSVFRAEEKKSLVQTSEEGRQRLSSRAERKEREKERERARVAQREKEEEEKEWGVPRCQLPEFRKRQQRKKERKERLEREKLRLEREIGSGN
ncbi:MAG: hypothetical protein LBD04_09365 [Synergistaceae bacterium]|jgi:hypothetical protein|nr:hypothetical protein [Synergistaceae bacterium]